MIYNDFKLFLFVCKNNGIQLYISKNIF